MANSNAEVVAIVILAAGTSSRMGDNKLLQKWRGKPLLAYAVETAAEVKRAGIVDFVVGVTGRDGDDTGKLFCNAADVVVHNDDYASGMSSSLRCGLSALPARCAAVLVMLGDMPLVKFDDVAAVVNVWRQYNDEVDVAVAAHNGKRGNPVLFSARLFAKVKELEGDTGARALFGGYNVREVETGAGVLFDIDMREQLEQ